MRDFIRELSLDVTSCHFRFKKISNDLFPKKMNSENFNSDSTQQYQWDSDSGKLINPFLVAS